MIDFTPAPEHAELAAATAAFVREVVVPYEPDPRWTSHGPTEELRAELVAHARRAGLYAPHVAERYGGRGLTHLGRAAVFEEAGWSILGPLALGIAAPDEGNAHLLEHVARPDQQDRWLAPLAAGEIRTAFAMTEPPPGAGSDPGMLSTTVVRDGADYVIDGRKWLITGAVGAAMLIVMAREDEGSTMLLVPADAPGVRIERVLDTLDSSYPGGHAVVAFEGVRVPADTVLGEPGQGFRYAQVRLAPARLTHCMRWLGAARRAHDAACAYARERKAFSQTLGSHEGVSFMLADNEMDIRTARLHILHAAWTLDRGERGGHESSIAKTVCSEAVWRVVDRSLQVLGGTGITDDSPVARILRDVRAFRVYDGPSEVHRWSIGRRVLRDSAEPPA